MDSKFTRLEALKSVIILPAMAALFVDMAEPASAKSSKAQFKYQTHPKGRQECDGCSLWIPGKKKTSLGACKVVAGQISPKGWCVAFSPKR
jgi:hypothetical protein